jgi:hypothetical protein
MNKLYTIDEVRKIAGTKDIYKTKTGYIYKIVKGKKEYIKIK